MDKNRVEKFERNSKRYHVECMLLKWMEKNNSIQTDSEEIKCKLGMAKQLSDLN